MKDFIAIFIGGGLGSMLRYGLGKIISTSSNYNIPLGTLVVNILACLALGLIIGLAESKNLFTTSTRLFWVVGFCGGFSTFSAFSYDSLTLLQQGQYSSVLLYVFASILICLAATYFGMLISEKI